MPPDVTFASLVHSAVSDAALRAELDDAKSNALIEAAVDGFRTIVEEAMAEAREPIRIVAQASPSELRVRIRERGLPLDSNTAKRDPAWERIASKVDAMHWHSHGASGTELELVAACATLPAREPAPAVAQDVPLAPPQQYTIRRFEPADAEAVARAFYLTYGYHYDFPAVYEPRRLTALNAGNRYLSTVAVAENGEIVGHYALSREPDQPIGDGCGAIVLPAHRGRDLLDKLRLGMEEEAKGLGLAAYYSEPVTDHDRTQRASEKFGAKPTGITLGCAPVSFLAKHMELSTTSQRQSTMLYFKLLKPPEARRIVAPRIYSDMIGRIYETLAIPATLEPDSKASGSGMMRTTVNKADGVATIDVLKPGVESANSVKQAICDLRALTHLGAIYLRMPLEEAGTQALCEVAREHGFFFSAVGPWMLEGKDALVLQLPLTPIDLSALTVVSDFSNELRDYIAADQRQTLNV